MRSFMSDYSVPLRSRALSLNQAEQSKKLAHSWLKNKTAEDDPLDLNGKRKIE